MTFVTIMTNIFAFFSSTGKEIISIIYFLMPKCVILYTFLSQVRGHFGEDNSNLYDSGEIT